MFKRTATAFAVTAVAGLTLAGCTSADEEPTDEATSGSTDETMEAAAGGDITMAVFNGWDESLATSLLWENILEEKGYNVELVYNDPAPTFQGVADGDYDVVTDVWLPLTHAAYLEEFGDDMERVGAWYDTAALTVITNADAPIDSIEEIPENADAFGNTIYGIEPGAGLTATMQDAVIPDYGLESVEFLPSSTPAMLSELEAALDNGENFIGTLWEPHWAYGAYDIKNLEDPNGSLGAAEELVTYSRTGFSDDFPEVTEWLSTFTIDGAQVNEIANNLRNAEESEYDSVISDWIAENQDYVDGLTS